MVVLTFSGPAVADAQPLALAAAVVGRQTGPRVVVMPPLAGILERLDQMIGFAREGRTRAARALAGRVAERHRDLVRKAAPGAAADVIASIDAKHSEIEGLMTGAHRGVSPEANDAVQAAGGMLSSAIMVAVLRESGVAATRVGATGPGSIAQQVAPILERGGVPVIAGTKAPMLSAATVSAAIGAREIQVWTEADGVLAADPCMVPAAHSVPQLSFAEALELARWGVRSLHAGSLQLASSRHTPIVIRNARRPDRPGTVIDGQQAAGAAVPAALACRRGAAALQFSSDDTRAPVFMRRILDWCGQSGEPQFVAAISGKAVTVAFDDPRGAEAVTQAAREFAHVTRLDDVALLSAVGEGLAADPRIAARILDAVQDVTVHASAQHPSGRSFTMLLDDADAGEAMKRVYERFFAPAGASGPVATGCEV